MSVRATQTFHAPARISDVWRSIHSSLENARLWSRAYRQARRELMAMTDRELTDLGIAAADIDAIARQTGDYAVRGGR